MSLDCVCPPEWGEHGSRCPRFNLQQARYLLLGLNSDEARLFAMQGICHHCGCIEGDLACQCENDE